LLVILTLFGAVANVSKRHSAFILSDKKRGGGKIPRCIDFNIDRENVNMNTLRLIGRLLRTVDNFYRLYGIRLPQDNFPSVTLCGLGGKSVTVSYDFQLNEKDDP
jgi:hypothetical protein